MKFLEESLVALDVDVKTPEEAIAEAGKLLVSSGAVEEKYMEAMLKNFKENGPYFVIAPHIALPHARPEDGVKEACVSMVRLKNAVKFGHGTNDPVKLVFGLGASSSEEHLAILKKLMSLLGDSSNIEKLLQIKSFKDIKKMMGGII